jgi:hypothetical protein
MFVILLVMSMMMMMMMMMTMMTMMTMIIMDDDGHGVPWCKTTIFASPKDEEE